MLLSLSFASLSVYIELRFARGCGCAKRVLLWDLGVGHSIGLLDREEIAVDEGLRESITDIGISGGFRIAEAIDLKPT
jgi:hypothetical protein